MSDSQSNNLGTLNTTISNLQPSLTTLQQYSSSVLSQQNSMNTIVNNESSRLNDKKQSIDNAYSSQQRAVYLTDNTQKQYNGYSKMLVVIVIGASVLFLLGILQPYLTFLPPFFIPIKYVTVFATVFIYCFLIYQDIQKHDPMNYDRIHQKTMDASGMDVSGSNSSTSDSSSNSIFCSNNACCATGTFFDTSLNQCLPNKQGFENINPVGAYEYSDYSPI
jgi:hypothetical protein